MAVQARPEVHDTTFPLAAVEQRAVGTVFGDPRSELTCNNNSNDISGWFAPSKRARVGDGLIMESHGAALLPPVPVAAFAGNAVCSVAASTSGRAPVASHGLLLLSSYLHCHGVEADALIRIENERLRVGLEEARRRHVTAAVSALETATARRLRDAEAELERALARNAELEERLRRTTILTTEQIMSQQMARVTSTRVHSAHDV